MTELGARHTFKFMGATFIVVAEGAEAERMAGETDDHVQALVEAVRAISKRDGTCWQCRVVVETDEHHSNCFFRHVLYLADIVEDPTGVALAAVEEETR